MIMKAKKKTVDSLIANETTRWKEGDREVLMAIEEEVLEKMIPTVNQESDVDKAAKDKAAEDAAKAEAEKNKSASEEATVTNAAAAGEEKGKKKEEKPVENMTAEEYISKKVPTELKGVFRSGLASYNATKDRLIDIITSNEKNIFTKEQLEAKDLDELKALVSLAVHTEEQEEQLGTLNYAGQRDAAHVEEEEPLDVPVMNFDGKK